MTSGVKFYSGTGWNHEDRLPHEAALWGVGTTAPYGHDGRSNTLKDVIFADGVSASLADAFALVAAGTGMNSVLDLLNSWSCFLQTIQPSTLDPSDPTKPQLPASGSGPGIKLGVLFNNPTIRNRDARDFCS